MKVQASSTLYPVLCVHEQEGPFQIETDHRFTIGHTVQKTELPTSISSYSNGDRIGFELVCERIHERGIEQIVLLFDPAHTGRRPHNFIRIGWNGKAAQETGSGTEAFFYERYGYEYVRESLPAGFQGTALIENHTLRLRLELPLSDIGVPFTLGARETGERRWIGFNMYRMASGGGDSGIVKWSGMPCDSIVQGHGMGDLLFTRGLEPAEIEAAVSRADAESRGLPTRWEKRALPAELHQYVTRKQQGMTGRIHRADAERARLNSEATGWGQAMRASIVEIADYWAAKSDDELFDLVPVGNPRALTVAQYYGDPLYGGNFRTLQTCLERPYEFYNPATGTWWRPGMIMRNPATGENVTIEDPGDGFVAPEGFPNPHVRYMFVGAYRLFLLGMLMGAPYCQTIEDPAVCPETSGKKYAGAINNLAYAFVLTGDRRYAHKALLLIGRIAELVPYMNGNFADGTLSDSVHISEPSTTETQWFDNFFEALDLIYDEIEACAPGLASFFSRKPDAEGRLRTTAFCVKETVHELVPYLLYSCEIEVCRTSDWSLRYIYKQLVLASFMQSGKLMRHVLTEGPHSLQGKLRNLFYREGRYAYDSLGYLEIICNQMIIMANNNYLFSDPEYYPEGINMFEDKQYGFQDIITFMFRVKTGGIVPAFGDWVLDNKEPLDVQRRKGLPVYTPAYEITFARMESARALIGPLLALYSQEELAANRLRVVNEPHLNHALLLLATASDVGVYERYLDESSLSFAPFLLQNSETSLLRHGRAAADCKHVMLYGQPTAGHAHGDKLGLWIGAFGYHLLAGVGAYPFTWISPKLSAWETHSAACMVTLIDGRPQASSYSKQLAHYEGVNFQLAGLQNGVMYPGSHAERWCWLVPAVRDEAAAGPGSEAESEKSEKRLVSSDAYVLDITYVRGGRTFDYNTAGMLSPDRVTFHGIAEDDWELLEGTLQSTLDGAVETRLYEKPGYGWMKAQRKAKAVASVGWTYQYDHAALKVHTVPDAGSAEREVVFSLGEMGFQHMGRADWLPFVMWRDQAGGGIDVEGKDSSVSMQDYAGGPGKGSAPEPAGEPGNGSAQAHAATFCTVLEPYEQRPFLRTVQPLKLLSVNKAGPFQPIGVEVTHEDGYRDILVSNYASGDSVVFQDSANHIISSDAKALLLRYHEGELISAEAVGFTTITAQGITERRETSELRGQIQHVEEKSGKGVITVELDSDSAAAFPELADIGELENRVALFDSPDYAKPSAYYICKPKLDGNLLTFETNITLVCLNADSPFEVKKRELGTKVHQELDGVEVLLDLKPGDHFTLRNAFVYMK